MPAQRPASAGSGRPLPTRRFHRRSLWERPWNLRADQTSPSAPRVPGRVYWATGDGGHEQIGCIYTAQGLEYDYGAMIIGPDLIRTPEGWEAHPEESRDPAMRKVGPDDYLTCALNTYRVLATRGTCFHSTDPVTIPAGAPSGAAHVNLRLSSTAGDRTLFHEPCSRRPCGCWG
ncbi:DNA/RNA helicase domain-containing protein [Streptomyces olivoreticuli]|uniref:DNA/RNA helicase domain-containing protein n=1 Tax=Streptomyces olivoreticuli TaxID=68246 RepID=UPI003CC7E753